MFNNSKIKVTEYELVSDKIKGEVRIAHLSDIHEKEFGSDNEALFSAVAALSPHIIAMTGDIIAHEKQAEINKEYVTTLARGLTHIAPFFFSSGNHEKNLMEDVAYIIEEHGGIITNGGISSVTADKNTVNIAGMHDLIFDVDVEAETDIFREAEGYNVFLSHRPECYESCLDKNIDLVLSGHTHAGQVRFPKIGAFAMYGQGFMPKYVQGDFTDGKTTMIISRGLGASGYPPVRVNNPPELVLVRIKGR